MIAALGRSTLAFILFSIEILYLAGEAFANLLLTLRSGSRPVLRVLHRQIYFTGIEAFQLVMIVGTAVGIAIISQILSINAAGSGSLIGKVLIWTVVRELAPIITALVVIARSGSAIATEMGNMNISGEIEHLESLAIPAGHYLLMPRIIGVAISVVILSIYFSLSAIFGGFAAASLIWHIPTEQFTQGIFAVLTSKEITASVMKSVFFGLIIATVSCRQGLRVGKSITQVPQAATRAVIQSLMLIFITDGVFSLLFMAL